MAEMAISMDEGIRRDGTSRRVIISAAIGNMAEYYDFSLFVFLSITIGHHFFPSHDPALSTLASLAAFGIAFLARPVGGAILGRMADRFGRKAVMLITFAMMAVATVGIGLLPGYDVLGIWAPILLIALRVVQGFSAGGEWGTSMAYGVEWAPQNRRALFGSIIQSGNALGSVLATAVIGLLIMGLGSDAFEAWGWRIAFLLGAAIIPIGLYLRRNAEESPIYVASEPDAPADAGPVAPAEAPRSTLKVVVLFFGLMCLPSAAIPTTAKYLPTFAEQYAGLSKSEAMWSTSFTTILLVLATPFFGILSDRIGRRPLLQASVLIYALTAWPLFNGMATQGGVLWVLGAQCVFGLATALTYGAIGATLVEMFSTMERAGKLSLLHSIQLAIFGGFSPLLAGWMIKFTGDPAAVAYYLVPFAGISLLALRYLPETAFRPLR